MLALAPPTSSLPASIDEFLQQLNLECYQDAFKLAGFDMLDTLQDLGPKDLRDMNIARGHQGKLSRKAKEVCKGLGLPFMFRE
jgi:hypothetical protein